jgi:hypothetical protein
MLGMATKVVDVVGKVVFSPVENLIFVTVQAPVNAGTGASAVSDGTSAGTPEESAHALGASNTSKPGTSRTAIIVRNCERFITLSLSEIDCDR